MVSGDRATPNEAKRRTRTDLAWQQQKRCCRNNWKTFGSVHFQTRVYFVASDVSPGHHTISLDTKGQKTISLLINGIVLGPAGIKGFQGYKPTGTLEKVWSSEDYKKFKLNQISNKYVKNSLSCLSYRDSILCMEQNESILLDQVSLNCTRSFFLWDNELSWIVKLNVYVLECEWDVWNFPFRTTYAN